MGVLAAGPGWSSGGHNTAATAAFVMLGPVPGGRILDRLRGSVSCLGASVLAFGCGLTNCGDDTQANFQSSRQLIQRTGATLYGRPAFGWNIGAACVFSFDVPIGVEVQTGGTYVICACSSTDAEQVVLWNIGLFPRFVWRVREGSQDVVGVS